jgi:malonyl CoA-acyl carrier protein transacylase
MTAPETNDHSYNVNFDADTLAPRDLRVVLVCDVVESVRWMEQVTNVASFSSTLPTSFIAKPVVAKRTANFAATGHPS